ncbi:MAG: hypothetical protein H6834_15400 [Planctomycetes bacterium]|nr:hypothetical protein [Planctomycetota bacterium]
MKAIQLYIAGEPHPLPAAVGFVKPDDPRTLELHAGSCAGKHPLRLFAGGRPGQGGLEIPMQEVEPGWYQPERAWFELLETRPIFGQIDVYVLAYDRTCAVSELDIPLASENQALLEHLRTELFAMAGDSKAMEGLSGLSRGRLFGSDEFALADWLRKLMDRAEQAIMRIEASPRYAHRDVIELANDAIPDHVALRHLSVSLRRGLVSRDVEGRGMPTQFVRLANRPDYDTPLNRAARAFVADLIAEGRNTCRKLSDQAKAAHSEARTRVFRDPLALRRAERLETSSRNLARSVARLQRTIAKGRPLGEAKTIVHAPFPVPLPSHPGYRALRALKTELLAFQKGEIDQEMLTSWLRRTVFDVPSLEGLYERWVGLKIIAALRASGLSSREEEEPEAMLRPGNRIHFQSPDGARQLILFVEPTFTPGRSPIRGVALSEPVKGDDRQRLTPDYALVRTHPQRSRPLLILDATLSRRQEVLEWKGAYARRLLVTRRQRVLGAMRTHEAVLSSVALFPGRGKDFESTDGMLRTGTLPLRPGRSDQFELLVELTRLLLDGDGPLLG